VGLRKEGERGRRAGRVSNERGGGFRLGDLCRSRRPVLQDVCIGSHHYTDTVQVVIKMPNPLIHHLRCSRSPRSSSTTYTPAPLPGRVANAASSSCASDKPQYGPYCLLIARRKLSASDTGTREMTAPPHPPPVCLAPRAPSLRHSSCKLSV